MKLLYYPMETTAHFVAQWVEARTRFSNQLKTLQSEDLKKKLGDSPTLLAYVSTSFDTLQSTLATQLDSAWSEVIKTKEFGTKTKAEALGRIVSHTAYHAGQMALLIKYGKI